jgi:PAS domain S-box-containing protein
MLMFAAVLTALAYAAVGGLALALAIPPAGVAPLYPPAGIALAACLVYGRAVLPGVYLGSLAVNLYAAAERAPIDPVSMALCAAMAFGAALQAGFGSWLARRLVAQPTVLNEPRDIARFFALVAPLACLISASIGIGALAGAGILSAAAVPQQWLAWWAGDTLGTLIAAPAVLTLIGKPRAEWAHRRLSVGACLLLATGLLALALSQLVRWDEERIQLTFEQAAERATESVASQMPLPLYALEAMRGLVVASATVSAEGFARAARPWLDGNPALQAVGHAAWVPRSDIHAHEAQTPTQGPSAPLVQDPSSGPAPHGSEPAWVVRHVESRTGRQAAPGLDRSSLPVAGNAIDEARRGGVPIGWFGSALAQGADGGAGITVLQALYAGSPVTEQQRFDQTAGLVFATLQPERMLAALRRALPPYLHVCIGQTQTAQQPAPLAGDAACTLAKAGAETLVHEQALGFSKHPLQLRVVASRAAMPEAQRRSSVLFAMVGLAAVALLGALLLTMTGRTRRIEAAVAERTADLQWEVIQHRRTESALRDSEQRLRNILDHIPIAVIHTDLAGRIDESNPKLQQMLGYSAQELSGMNVLDITHPDDRAAELTLSTQLVRGEIPVYRRDKRNIAKDGRIVWVLAVVTVLCDTAGRPQRMVGVMEDITEHLKLQEAEQARARAEAASRAKSDFVSRMSHELRTPLNAMLGFAQLLELDRQQPLADHQMQWTGRIQQAGWHLLHMINDTLDLSRIESGTLRLDVQALDVTELARATADLLQHNAQRRRVSLTIDIDPEANSVMGDLTRVKQILTNLMSNAIKYNAEGGRVRCTSRLRDEGIVEIEVSDTGLGMSPEQLSELFQPFNRLGREKSGEEGTGIGLVISQRLTELMGGTLRARSTPGVGSSFVLALAHAGREAGSRALADDSEPAALFYRQRIVHYIEDNETNAEVMRGILAQRPQIKLDVSANGLDGIAAIRLQHPSLILLDMHLPDIDGLELLRHLKSDPATADIPVVVVSADATAARITEATAAGAAHYLTKPVNVVEILSLLDQQLENLDTRFG